MSLLVGVRRPGSLLPEPRTARAAHDLTTPHRPALVSVLVSIEVAAILFAAILFTVSGAAGARASCQHEVSAVQSAVAQYHLTFGPQRQPSLAALESLGLLKTKLTPTGPSTRAGYVYDAATGRYSGGVCR